MFSIDSDRNIQFHPDPSKVAGREDLKTFGSYNELAAILADQTRPQLAEIWNGFAGVGQFNHLKPVKGFTHQASVAIRRIWNAIQCLRDGSEATETEQEPEEKARKPRKTAAKAPQKAISKPKRQRRQKTATPAKEPRQGSKKALAIAMISREKGASQAELMEKFGWQPHTVRGFISTLGSKHGFKTTSEKSETRGLVYKAA